MVASAAGLGIIGQGQTITVGTTKVHIIRELAQGGSYL